MKSLTGYQPNRTKVGVNTVRRHSAKSGIKSFVTHKL